MSDQHPPTMPAGWYDDPIGVGDARYWDGGSWTETISTRGITMNAPIEEPKAKIPPVPGTEFAAPPKPRAAPPPSYTPRVSQTRRPAPPPRRSSAGVVTAIVGLVLAILIATVLVLILTGDDANDPTNPTEAPILTDDPPPPT